MLLVDAANVIGSRPTGWWKDRPGAARTFVERVRAAVERAAREPVVVVLEGKARDGVDPGEAEGVIVLHASRSGDDKLLEVIAGADGPVTLVSADRALCERAQRPGGRGRASRMASEPAGRLSLETATGVITGVEVIDA